MPTDFTKTLLAFVTKTQYPFSDQARMYDHGAWYFSINESMC